MENIIISFIMALGLCLSGLGINYAFFRRYGWLKFAINTYGGEIIVEDGFGLTARHIYTMTSEWSDSVSLSFNIISFIIWLLVIWLILYLFALLAGKIVKSRK